MKMSKKRIIYTVAVTLIVVFSSTFAILMTLERTDYRNYLQAEYSKNMYELISSVQNIRVNLSKAPIVGSREQSIIVFEEIFRHSAMANDKLDSLPISQDAVENTNKFLSQVGDFCYSLATAASEGKALEEKDYKNIEDLKNRSFELEARLSAVSDDINQGKVKWGELRKKVGGVFAKERPEVLVEKFKGIQKQVAQYPALIYDGPFSDNIVEIEPRINKEKEISSKQGEEIARKIIGNNRVESIKLINRESNTRIPSYSYEVAIKGRGDKSKVICEISKHGGKVVYLLDSKGVSEAKISRDKAIQLGADYLKKVGYDGMIPMYSLNYANTAVISYVYKQDDVVIYPDQVKIKIALDDGNVIGIESEQFLVSHNKNRDIKKPKISEEEARKRVGKKLNVTSTRLAIVPTEMHKEVLCYEFAGNYNNQDFIVYINADTGFEQRIIEIIDTPNGQLTM
ncbi:germination protein YpeB [uncultured Clostridium sp.]|uniref:germination protein YpeB n=1 Tax=uncultured Clostridium sp. TaxID=59620 RepID=UPI0028EF3908|nr:germination protein YpeB [uncultured Clostridium sp.]